MLFSKNINANSKLLLNRNVIQRAKKIAPFLEYDENPYIVINNEGRLIWVIDAYTTSNSYPYSQSVELQTSQGTFSGKKSINYIRNSVKVLIDAYDGTTTFYIIDRSDPVIMAYWRAYPEIFANLDDETIPDDIWRHIQYPEYLFKIQSEILQRYHETQPEIFYRNDDPWTITLETKDNANQKTNPYYIPAQEDKKIIQKLAITFSPLNRQNIIAYLTVSNNSKDNYGKLTLYNLSKDSNILGPLQIDTQIDQNEEISKNLKSWSTGGYKVIRSMTVIPIENSFLYVEPIQIVAVNESVQIPYVKKVIVASGNKLAIGDDFKDALNKLVSQNVVNIEIKDTDDIDTLIDEIIRANTNLKESSSNNDWEMIGKDLKSLQDLIDKLEKKHTLET